MGNRLDKRNFAVQSVDGSRRRLSWNRVERGKMKYLSPERWWLVASLYLLGGFALGLADLPLGEGVRQLGVKPGWATAASVNLLLPLIAVGLGAAFPRLSMAWLGALAMTASYVLGLALVHPPKGWDVGSIVRSIPPVLVVACLGYALLGTLAVVVARRIRKST
jgi:hypothetical protein